MSSESVTSFLMTSIFEEIPDKWMNRLLEKSGSTILNIDP